MTRQLAPMTSAQYLEHVAKSMREDALQARVLAFSRLYGWLAYHTHDSRRSQRGFPDLVLVHPGRQLVLYRELKAHKGRVTPDQRQWLDALTAAGQDAGIWRPADLLDDAIEKQLAGDAYQAPGGHW